MALTSVLLLFQVGFTSAPGQGGILAQREFDRRFSPHFVSGTVWSGMRPPWVLGPLSPLGRFNWLVFAISLSLVSDQPSDILI